MMFTKEQVEKCADVIAGEVNVSPEEAKDIARAVLTEIEPEWMVQPDRAALVDELDERINEPGALGNRVVPVHLLEDVRCALLSAKPDAQQGGLRYPTLGDIPSPDGEVAERLRTKLRNIYAKPDAQQAPDDELERWETNVRGEHVDDSNNYHPGHGGKVLAANDEPPNFAQENGEWSAAPKFDVVGDGLKADLAEARAQIAAKDAALDPIIKWMVQHGWLDAGNEYTAADLVATLDDNAAGDELAEARAQIAKLEATLHEARFGDIDAALAAPAQETE